MKQSNDLHYFLHRLRNAGPDFYMEAKRPLDPDLMPCVLLEKLATHNRFPVMFCPTIKGSQVPLVMNLLGSYELLGKVLDMDLKTSAGIEEKYFAFSDVPPQKVDRIKLTQILKQRAAAKKQVIAILPSRAPVKEVILKGKDVDLGILPITRHGELDSDQFITAGCTICKHP